jgi:hypothetical protein
MVCPDNSSLLKLLIFSSVVVNVPSVVVIVGNWAKSYEIHFSRAARFCVQLVRFTNVHEVGDCGDPTPVR